MTIYHKDPDPQKGSCVLISGGSGLIGKYLTSLLTSKGYEVRHLSRNNTCDGKVKAFRWDPEEGFIDSLALTGIDYIINLAGANIGEKRWTKKRKKIISGSRIESTRFLHELCTTEGISLKAFISSSATGYYGSVTSDKIYKEKDPPANDFLGNTCREWEEAATRFEYSGIRTVKIRSAVVLEKNDSALSRLMWSGKFGFLLQTGNGKQFIPWIHIDDLCNIYLKALEDSNISGSYNASSPQHVTHKAFMKTLATVIKKPVFPVPVPGLILKAVLGEMSDVVLKGSRINSGKIVESGYKFIYPDLECALRNIISK